MSKVIGLGTAIVLFAVPALAAPPDTGKLVMGGAIPAAIAAQQPRGLSAPTEFTVFAIGYGALACSPEPLPEFVGMLNAKQG